MPQPGTFLSRATHVRSMERKKVGEVFHFFGHIGVAAIKLTDGSLAVGDTVQIQGPTTNLEQPVDSLQIEHGAVSIATPFKMTSRNASAERPLKPASMSMNFSRCVPWNRDPPIRTKKNSRTSGSFQCPPNVE